MLYLQNMFSAAYNALT